MSFLSFRSFAPEPDGQLLRVRLDPLADDGFAFEQGGIAALEEIWHNVADWLRVAS